MNKLLKNLKKKFKKICQNINYKVRYENLLVKYETSQKRIKELEEFLDENNLANELINTKKYLQEVIRQRDTVRQDYIKLSNRKAH